MQATATAPSNIAFIKYWGNLDRASRLAFNDSLSMNLDAARSTTQVTFEPDLSGDVITIDGQPISGQSATRVSAHLDRVRALAGATTFARVSSSNTFPMGTGIASSASAFAALTLAACTALGLDLATRELSALARLGSGSAARSIPDGFVAWRAGPTDQLSYAETVASPDHWELRDLVAIVDRRHKAVGSTDGHAAALRSPLFAARLANLSKRADVIADALARRDLELFGEALEAEALELHAVAMTGSPSLLYWSPATVALLHAVRTWRGAGIPVYATLDAGPNVHLICEAPDAERLLVELDSLDYVEQVITNRPAVGARVVGGDTGAPPGPA